MSGNEDPFSVLTATSTVTRASPRNPNSIFEVPAPSSPVQVHKHARRPRHSSGSRADDGTPASPEFGSFVSVEAVNDPLQPLEFSPDFPSVEPVPASPSGFFDKLKEEAKQRSEMNERRVLSDLKHADENDPLQWLSNAARSSSVVGPDCETLPHEDGADLLSSALKEAGSTLIDLTTPLTKVSPTLPIGLNMRSPSLDITNSSSESTKEQVQNMSPSTTLSRSWMSSFISSPRPSPSTSSSVLVSYSPPSTPAIDSQDKGSEGLSPTQSTLHALFSRAQHARTLPTAVSSIVPSSRKHARQATDTLTTFSSTSVPPGISPSPFAAHPFIPPSGAPGFTGDHNWNTQGFDFDETTLKRQFRLIGRKEGTSPVLDIELADLLRSHLPALSRLPNTWSLLYSLDQHGISLNTLYTRCETPRKVLSSGKPGGVVSGGLLAIKDSEGGIFGAWVAEGVHLSHGSFYGGGDAFLWCTHASSDNGQRDMQVYKWTGRNDYVALCDPSYISFGGGDGHYGLYIDSSLLEGTSGSCPTFGNGCLSATEPNTNKIQRKDVPFECVGLEVWGVGP